MTDLTTDAPAVPAAETSVSARRRGMKAEFIVYFAIIFAATLPLALLTWALHAIKSRGLPEKGPVARAWTQARIITPMIFAA